MAEALKVRDCMTACPHTLEPSRSVAEASALMREHSIRHVPVVEEGSLNGLLSDRDVTLVLSLVDVDPARVRVSDVMAPDPMQVSPDAALGDVAGEMAERKSGAAVVTDGTQVVGIFTTVDALRALQGLLRETAGAAERPAP